MTTALVPPATDGELTRRRLLVYGIGSVGTGIFSTVPGLLLLYFMTDALGVPAGIAGLVVALPKAWDAVFNPWSAPPATVRPSVPADGPDCSSPAGSRCPPRSRRCSCPR